MKKDPIRTRQKIEDAFLQLYEEKRVETISIGEITARAGVYRGTFYYYYQDIYDLLSQIEEKMLEKVKELVPELIEALLSGRVQEKEALLNAFVQKNETVLNLFFVKRPNPPLLKRCKEYAKGAALRKLGIDGRRLPCEAEYVMEYIASAQIGLITMWLERGRDIRIEQFISVVSAANLQGPVFFLEEYAKKDQAGDTLPARKP